MRLTVTTKLMVLAGLGLAAAGSVGVLAYVKLVQTHDLFASVTSLNQALRNYLEGDMMHDALRGDVYAALAAQTDQEKADAKAALVEHAEWFRRTLEENKALDLPEAIDAELAGVGPKLDAYIDSATELVSLGVSAPEEARQKLPEFAQKFEELEEQNEAVSDAIESLAASTKDEMVAVTESAAFKVMVMLGVSVAALAAAGRGIAVSIARPLGQCVGVMQSLAAGDLTRRVNMTRDDEIGAMATATDGAIERTADLVGKIRDASSQVAAAATQITASSEEMSSEVASQADQLGRIAASMSELAGATENVAARSTEADNSARQSEGLAQTGGEVVGKTVTDMQTIATAVQEGADCVSRLGQRGDEIGQIIAVINDIADQTNLLALNAAIEAARAGEHGRGFAVVADEVRKLADRTTKATEEIGVSIRAIQQETTHAVERIGHGAGRVKEGVSSATSAGDALRQIVGGSRQVGQMIQQIAAAAQQQIAITHEVSGSVASLRSASDRTTQGADQAAQAAGTLSRKAEELDRLVGVFKVVG
jgi:methyl-accepting chemotaxis protein